MSRILVADDDPEMRLLLSSALREAGYEVVEAKDGVDLLFHLEFDAQDGDWSSLFDVIVTDVRMPGVTGLEVLEGMREVEKSTGVILISAFADEQTQDDATRLGASAVLTKPFGVDAFLAAVRDLAPPRSSPKVAQG